MDPNQVRFEELYTLTKENNIILKKVRRGQVTAQWTRAFYWIFIVVLTFGGLYFIKPYLTNVLNIYTGGQSSGIPTIGQVPDLIRAQQILEQLKGL